MRHLIVILVTFVLFNEYLNAGVVGSCDLLNIEQILRKDEADFLREGGQKFLDPKGNPRFNFGKDIKEEVGGIEARSLKEFSFEGQEYIAKQTFTNYKDEVTNARIGKALEYLGVGPPTYLVKPPGETWPWLIVERVPGININQFLNECLRGEFSPYTKSFLVEYNSKNSLDFKQAAQSFATEILRNQKLVANLHKMHLILTESGFTGTYDLQIMATPKSANPWIIDAGSFKRGVIFNPKKIYNIETFIRLIKEISEGNFDAQKYINE